jgi:uncharacterized membrane protein YgdD (TMEM256/DUF423 family)
MQQLERQRGMALLIALIGASAVLLGAAGAHALHAVLGPRGEDLWRTAVGYHFWHALAFTLGATVAPQGRARRLALCAFVLGIVLFSGSLYALALGAPSWLGALTPVGGLAFVIGWLALGSSFGSRRGG